MYIIVLHPDDELKIIQFQKQIISLNYDSMKLIKKIPLWIPLKFLPHNDFPQKYDSDSTSQIKSLKTISKLISKIQIQAPEVKDDLYSCQVKITFDNKDYFTELPLLQFLQKPDSAVKIKNPLEENILPMDLKIFRIADAVSLSEKNNAFAIEDSVWKKLI